MDGIVSVSSVEKVWGSPCEGTVGGPMVGVEIGNGICGGDSVGSSMAWQGERSIGCRFGEVTDFVVDIIVGIGVCRST